MVVMEVRVQQQVDGGIKPNNKGQEQLFISLADGVSHALLQIARLSESAQAARRQSGKQWQSVHDISQATMQLLEGYSLTLRLQQGLQTPVAEPVAAKVLLAETARLLRPYAEQYGVQIELDVSSRLEPVLSDRLVLQSALLSLGQVFVMANAEREDPQPVRLAAHRSRYGIVVGVYGQGLEMTSAALRRARSLRGKALQPYSQFVSGAASGVFVADGLLESVASKLHASRYHNTSGLAATIPACRQLQIV